MGQTPNPRKPRAHALRLDPSSIAQSGIALVLAIAVAYLFAK